MTDTTTKTTDPLDQLANQAQASLTEPPLGEGMTDLDTVGEPAKPEVSNAQALSAALAAGREAFCLFTQLESPRQTLSDDTVQQLAGLWAPVLEKHNINVGRYLGDYAAEIAAVMGTLTIALTVRAGVKAEIAARAPEQAEKLPEAKPVAAGVAPMTDVHGHAG